MASTASHITAAQLAFGMITFADGSPGVREIANGTRGQAVTFVLAATATPSLTIADDTAGTITKTGWSRILFDTAGDRITLVWLDDSSGWIIESNSGCTITP